jgi:DNA polymerase I
MALFNLSNSKTDREIDSKLAGKIITPTISTKKTTSVKNNNGGLIERINNIVTLVNKHLGKYKDKYTIIKEEEVLKDYLKVIKNNGIYTLDTETSHIIEREGAPDPMTCLLVGLCIYTPGQKAAYIPISHISHITGQKINNQLDIKFIIEQFKQLENPKYRAGFFNAKYDIRVLKHQMGLYLTPEWDGFIAARLLNENESQNNLKFLHNKYILGGEKDDSDALKFSDLFGKIPFNQVPIGTAYLYAAGDSIKTYELNEFQREYLTPSNEKCKSKKLEDVAKLYKEIELPLISVTAEMEDNGISFDLEYAKELSIKYHAKLDEIEKKFHDFCKTISKEIDYYQRIQAKSKLKNPINMRSTTQLSILLYDILKVKPVFENPRGTGDEILQKLNHPLVKIIQEYREISKLLSTYIDKLPKLVNPNTGKIHCSLNQAGTNTGRYSSSEPNMQNIPAHNKDIRQMFKASDNCLLACADYSSQEPRLTAHISQDKRMIQAFIDGKDMYSEIAAISNNLPYYECTEFRKDGTKNPEGKERRSHSKAIVLGICYGKGIKAIAEDLRVTKEKAQQIYNKVMFEFPGLKNFMEESQNMARTLGYVTTNWGRKRRLPDIQLERYEYSYISQESNALDFDDEIIEVDEDIKRKYNAMLNSAWKDTDRQKIYALALANNIKIKNNGGLIAQAERQCVNSRIQGSAADQVKIALLLIYNNKEFRKLKAKLLLCIHDEIIIEAPKENMKKCVSILEECMLKAGESLSVSSKVDTEVSDRWFGTTIKL